jgi:hypothetical protein
LIRYDGRTVDALFKLAYVSVGSVSSAFLSVGSPAGIHRIKKMLPKCESEVHERIAFCGAMAIGVVAGYVLYDGNDPIRAIVTGATSVAVLKQVANKR